METTPRGSSSANAFRVYERTNNNHGPVQVVEMSCLTPGQTYQFEFDYFIETDEGSPLSCVVNTSDPMNRCVDVAIKLANENWREWVLLRNDSGDPMVPGEFTRYHASFQVTEKMTEAESVEFFMSGPRPGAAIVFDNVRLYA